MSGEGRLGAVAEAEHQGVAAVEEGVLQRVQWDDRHWDDGAQPHEGLHQSLFLDVGRSRALEEVVKPEKWLCELQSTFLGFAW